MQACYSRYLLAVRSHEHHGPLSHPANFPASSVEARPTEAEITGEEERGDGGDDKL